MYPGCPKVYLSFKWIDCGLAYKRVFVSTCQTASGVDRLNAIARHPILIKRMRQPTKILLLLSLALVSYSSSATGSVNFVPVGCYRDSQLKPRPLPELIHNYRLNDEMDWKDLNGSVVQACAQEAHSRNYVYFGIQFYGECWSGPRAHETYFKDGLSRECIDGVGEGFANMVYRLAGEDNECVNYKTFDSEDRSASKDNIVGDLKCDDDKFQAGWYRFEGQAGTQINALKIKNRCQTLHIGYYTGAHPGPNEGIVENKICFTDICDRNKDIKIRNCGEFYVYYLNKTGGCPARYCGDGKTSTGIQADI
ncbi:uncharacterized protein LOC116308745 isoform X1 [Actinia tenebrosa]|uniref:Uncharacterized protein LOC116308745 isoform X1 n=1 Tax=Actinia tenebrosa TaxID=6105 RepID=A0A6P8JFI7_ACTTE|nr:uncharacterized protein LOC116308745 isoform X1 [Actinia tenebrosa]